MALSLDLAPTVEARLQAQAHIRDMSVSEFVKMLLSQLDELEAAAGITDGDENDPELIINEAVREMKENQIKNRELVVQVITQKNMLQAEVAKEERLVAEYEKKAAIALKDGNRELAKQLFKEKALHEQVLQKMQENLATAEDASEKVKAAIRQEEERIRARTAQALVTKANLKQAQMLGKVNQALYQFQFTTTPSIEWNETWDQAFEEWVEKQKVPAVPMANEEATSPDITSNTEPQQHQNA
jgi:phage shock protein A